MATRIQGTRIMAIAALMALRSASAADTPSLDYTFFKERVQPIFLKKRPGHARCVTCHSHGAPPLQPLAGGAATWDEKQSRTNFEVWRQFVVPGQPLKSMMLRHPLATDAGGDHFHA